MLSILNADQIQYELNKFDFDGHFHSVPQHTNTEAMVSSPIMQKKVRILVVDDKAAVLLTYRIILQQNGYDVVAVSSYGDAIMELNAHEFDLLLCDLGLDGNRTGFDVIRYAEQRVPGIRSVLLTGFSGEEVAQEAAERGIPVLFKPVDVRDLLSTVQESGMPREETPDMGGRAIA